VILRSPDEGEPSPASAHARLARPFLPLDLLSTDIAAIMRIVLGVRTLEATIAVEV